MQASKDDAAAFFVPCPRPLQLLGRSIAHSLGGCAQQNGLKEKVDNYRKSQI